MMTEFTQRKLWYLPPASPRVKTNKQWEEWEKDQLLLACRKYGTKVCSDWVFRDKALVLYLCVMYVMGLKIEGFVFLPDTPGKYSQAVGEWRRRIIYCLPAGSKARYDD